MKHITDVIQLFPDYTVITDSSSELTCSKGEHGPSKLVGYCDTPWGWMVVLECPVCNTLYKHSLYRNHALSMEEFEDRLIGLLYSDSVNPGTFFTNGAELYLEIN